MPQYISGDKVLLSTAEARELTGFSMAYIVRLLRDKRVEGTRVGTVWLVYEDSLKAFMAQPRKRGPKGPHKKSELDQMNISPDSKHVEVGHTQEGKMHAEGKGAEASE